MMPFASSSANGSPTRFMTSIPCRPRYGGGMTDIDEVLSFWFGEPTDDGMARPEVQQRWWKKDAAFDASIQARFGATFERAVRGELQDWADSPRGRVALVIVLDQFSRNLGRGSGEAFANDPAALRLASAAVERGELDELPPLHAYFLLMPFMHAEDVEAQRRCVELFRERAARAPNEALRRLFEGGADFAERHRVIVERFGRFPHRNALLGRASSPEEEAFLKEPGSSF